MVLVLCSNCRFFALGWEGSRHYESLDDDSRVVPRCVWRVGETSSVHCLECAWRVGEASSVHCLQCQLQTLCFHFEVDQIGMPCDKVHGRCNACVMHSPCKSVENENLQHHHQDAKEKESQKEQI